MSSCSNAQRPSSAAPPGSQNGHAPSGQASTVPTAFSSVQSRVAYSIVMRPSSRPPCPEASCRARISIAAFHGTREGRLTAALTVLRWSRALCHRHRGSLFDLGAPRERESGVRIPERPTDRENREPDPREKKGDPDHDPEQCELRSHV